MFWFNRISSDQIQDMVLVRTASTYTRGFHIVCNWDPIACKLAEYTNNVSCIQMNQPTRRSNFSGFLLVA
jgi:hypothetical protein